MNKSKPYKPAWSRHTVVCKRSKNMQHTSVLFTGNSKSPFSSPHISITTGPICIKFACFMPSIYMTFIQKMKKIRVVCEICVSENCPIFFIFFFFFALIYNNNFSQGWISFKFGALIRHILAYLQLKFRIVFMLKLRESEL